MKFSSSQWELYNTLKLPESFERDKLLRRYPLGSSTSGVFCRCPLCHYETNSTNVHRHCPLSPLMSNDAFINGDVLPLHNKLSTLSMVTVESGGKQFNGYVPRGWNKYQRRRDITQTQWDEIIAQQDFITFKSE